MKTIKILLAALLLGFAATEMQAEEPAAVRWARPVKATTTFEQDSVKYYLVEGEWFETPSQDKGNFLYDGIELKADSAGILDYEKRDSLNKHDQMDLRGHLRIVNDSIIYFNFDSFEKKDSVRLIDAASGKIVKTLSLNKCDSLVFADTLISRKSIIRLSPENNLSEVIKLEEIESEKVVPETVDIETEASKGHDIINLILISVVVVLVIVIAVLVFLLLRARKPTKPTEETPKAEDERGEHKDTALDQPARQEETPEVVDVADLKAKLSMAIAKNNTLIKQLQKAKEDLAAEQDGRKQAIETESARIRQKADKEIAAAESRAEKAEEKARTIKQEVTEQFKAQINALEDEKTRLNGNLSETKTKLRETEENLTAETAAHAQAKRKIESLNQAISRFDDKLGDAAFAQPYCRNIEVLLNLSAKVQKSANAALDADVEDPYFICKAIARFSAQVDEINLLAFYTDVDMVLRTGFVPKGTPLAAYDSSLPKAELEGLTKNYFFASYLKQYINALVVLNESMAGLAHLMPDMPADMVRPFEQYRGEIQSAVAALEINVLSVKIFDFVHNNTDLLATQVDGGYDTPGIILDIENCLVSLAGAPKDGERIRVKVQQ